MNKFWKTVLLNIAIIYGVSLAIAIASTLDSFLIAPIVIAVLQLIVAVFLLISEKTRAMGQAMFAASGLVLLLGFAVCSVATSL